MAMTKEQALALAAARKRQAEQQNPAQPAAQGDIGDVISASFTSGVNAIPFLGPTIMGGLNQVKAAVHGVPAEEIAAENAQLEEQNPVASVVGSIAGPTVALAPLGATTIGARMLGLTGTTGGRMLAGGGSGAAIAGLDSYFTRGNSAGDALFDAGMGAGIGAALPAVSKAGGWLRDVVLGRAAPKEAQNLARALRDDEIPIDQVNQRLADMGPDAMVMDLGPNLQSQAGAVASVPGPGQRVVREAVNQRRRTAPGRVQADVDATIGSGPEVGALRDGIVQRQSQAATPLYDAIRDVPIEAPPQLRAILQRPQGQQAIRDAVDMAANDGFHFPTSGNVMTVGLADYIKRSLDDMASAAARAGRNNEARTARNMARAITSSVDALEPRYAQAREAFAGPAQVLDAIDSGMTVFNKEMSPAQLRRELAGMSASERDGFIQGAQAQIEAMLGNAVNDVATLRNTFRKGWNEAKLRALLGDDIANDLLHRIDRELAFGQTSNAVASNSETARRIASQREVDPRTGEMAVPRGRTFIDLFESAFNLARNSIQGVRQPQINRGMSELHTARQLTPDQMRLLENGARATRPATIPPAAVAIIEQQRRRQPVEITVRGGN
jgi:hypothetical protein